MICNAKDLCEGTITRTRKTVIGSEISVLDYFIICQELFFLLCFMKIDEKQNVVLSRYSKSKGKTIVTPFDHNLLICKFNQSWSNKIFNEQKRYEVFNFKNIRFRMEHCAVEIVILSERGAS